MFNSYFDMKCKCSQKKWWCSIVFFRFTRGYRWSNRKSLSWSMAHQAWSFAHCRVAQCFGQPTGVWDASVGMASGSQGVWVWCFGISQEYLDQIPSMYWRFDAEKSLVWKKSTWFEAQFVSMEIGDQWWSKIINRCGWWCGPFALPDALPQKLCQAQLFQLRKKAWGWMDHHFHIFSLSTSA